METKDVLNIEYNKTRLDKLQKIFRLIPEGSLQSFANRLSLTPEQYKKLCYLREPRDSEIDKMFANLVIEITRGNDIDGALDNLQQRGRVKKGRVDYKKFPIFKLLPVYEKRIAENVRFPLLDVINQLNMLKNANVSNANLYTFKHVSNYIYIWITKSGIIYDSYNNQILWKHLSRYKTSGWYPCVKITGNDKKETKVSLHRLLGLAYLPIPNHIKELDDLVINHIDGDKTNFDLSNLEWCTRSENNKHAMRNGLNEKSSIHPMRKISVTNPLTGKTVIFNTMGEASEFMRVKKINIFEACNRVNNHHKGYLYSYV